MSDAPHALLEVTDLCVHYPGRTRAERGRVVKAVDGVSFSIARGETLGLVGESGCGKSSLARAILRLVPITDGNVRFDGHDLPSLDRHAMRALRPRMQLVFQDAGAALNPRWRVRDLVAEPLLIHNIVAREQVPERVDELFASVGLDPNLGDRLPRELSGGQKQRIGIARAIALDPDLLICDEPTAALDLSSQARILELLRELQARLGLAYLFITHDLGVVRQISDRVAVMYLGEIVEQRTTEGIFGAPQHPYSQALLDSVPDLEAPPA